MMSYTSIDDDDDDMYQVSFSFVKNVKSRPNSLLGLFSAHQRNAVALAG